MSRFESALFTAADLHDRGLAIPRKARAILETEQSADDAMPFGLGVAGFHGDSASACAAFILAAADKRDALLTELLRWASSERRPDGDEQQRLAARILSQHGEVDRRLIEALGLGAQARWSNVAERFDAKWNPKPSRAAPPPAPTDAPREKLRFVPGTPVLDLRGKVAL
ncbi:hypothetical protein [Methylosinus sp. RM1]|uniref:hypothetical protein n=1 Tax=Methylosinus sp. RM1 TaxID=2583817 RepID=UPI00140DB17C|nr:hypothetical protein [Methylosinus sp. RM1]